MKPLSDTLKIVTQEDVDLAKWAPTRSVELGLGNDADSANLMGLLGDIDGLKNEIHERMRRIEAVKQAKSILQEDAERTEALNRRLAEIGKAMSVAHAGFQAGEAEKEAAELARMQSRSSLLEAELRHAAARVPSEAVALSWPRAEELFNSTEGNPAEAAAQIPERTISNHGAPTLSAEADLAFEAAFQRLEELERSRMQAWTQADEVVQEAKRLLEDATSQLKSASGREEKAAQELHVAQEALATAFQSAQGRLEEAERSREAVHLQAWKQADTAAEEAKRLLDDVKSQLNQAISSGEQAAREFHSAQQVVSAAHQATSERLEEAERGWKKSDQAVLEARKLLEQSTAELVQARKKEESIAASLQSVRHEFTAAYKSASERLEEAEQFWKNGDLVAREGQKLIDQSTAELLHAKRVEETAAADLLSARQELTTAYQFAAVAAQRRLDAVESFQKSARWAVFGVTLSWIAVAWMAWFAFFVKIPVWAPGAASLVLVLVAYVVTKRSSQDA